jgi:hypothetical protein
MDSVMGMHEQQLKSIGIGFPIISTQAEWNSAAYISGCETWGH